MRETLSGTVVATGPGRMITSSRSDRCAAIPTGVVPATPTDDLTPRVEDLNDRLGERSVRCDRTLTRPVERVRVSAVIRKNLTEP